MPSCGTVTNIVHPCVLLAFIKMAVFPSTIMISGLCLQGKMVYSCVLDVVLASPCGVQSEIPQSSDKMCIYISTYILLFLCHGGQACTSHNPPNPNEIRHRYLLSLLGLNTYLQVLFSTLLFYLSFLLLWAKQNVSFSECNWYLPQT